MKAKIKAFLIARRITVNFVYFLGNLLGANNKTVSVLCYHNFSPKSYPYGVGLKNFAKQMERISKHSRSVSLSETVSLTIGKNLAGPAVSITFDDGYADVIRALPIIKKYKIPATIFVLADPKNADRKELNHNGKLLSWKQIKKLQKEGWTIGCHSATHADFAELSLHQIKKEVIDAKKSIEQEIGVKVQYFAYPKGALNNKIIKAVKEAGYKAAFGVWPSTVKKESSKWNIPRIVIDKTHTLAEFPAIYSPSVLLLRRVLNPFWRLFPLLI